MCNLIPRMNEAGKKLSSLSHSSEIIWERHFIWKDDKEDGEENKKKA